MSEINDDDELTKRGIEQDNVLKSKEIECKNRIESYIPSLTDDSYCKGVWDGILCWINGPADTVVHESCPDYIFGFNTSAKASKYCTSNGTWYINPETNTTWSNYTLCTSKGWAEINIDANKHASSIPHTWLPIVKVVQQVGYGVSISTLLLALLVLLFSKRLKCPRNILHINLFMSFILRALMTILKDSLFVQGVGLSSDVSVTEGEVEFLPDKDNWACKVVTSIWQFCIMANYSWILMEGLYLHNLIFMALFTDSSAITLYLILGWGLPVAIVVPWIILRATLDDNLCWTTHENRLLYLIIRIPIILSVLVNFGLFLNIVRVLMLKFKASLSAVRRRASYGKWARSTLILMPLFGVHYALSLCMSYWLEPRLEIFWIFFDQLFASFQGFLVSLLFCLLNAEVHSEFARFWRIVRSYIFCCSPQRDQPEEGNVTSLLLLSRLQLANRGRYRGDRDRDVERPRDRSSDRNRDRDRERSGSGSGSRDRPRDRYRDIERSRSRDRPRDLNRDRSRDRPRDRDREISSDRSRSRQRQTSLSDSQKSFSFKSAKNKKETFNIPQVYLNDVRINI